MPQLDGTGPQGKGSKTGRGAGNCDDTKKDQEPRQGSGLGARNGLGRGQGRRRGFFSRFGFGRRGNDN